MLIHTPASFRRSQFFQRQIRALSTLPTVKAADQVKNYRSSKIAIGYANTVGSPLPGTWRLESKGSRTDVLLISMSTKKEKCAREELSKTKGLKIRPMERALRVSQVKK